MTEQELLQMRDLAEAGQVQFKERAIDRYDINCEMVAFSNTRGGRLVIGINDKSGAINALSYFFPSVLPNSNQCQAHPLNCVEVSSRPFSLTLYTVLPEVAVKIPVHAFNSPMLFGYLTKPLCTAIQA